MKNKSEHYVGSLTIDEEKQKQILENAYKYVETEKADYLKISVEPQYITKEFIKMLKKYGVKSVELEVQSTNEYILKKSNLEYNYETIKKASKLIRWNRMKLGFQVSVGMLDSTKLDELNTAKELIKLKPKHIRISLVLVEEATKLEEEYKEGQYEPLTINQAVERYKELIYTFNKKKIKDIIIETKKSNENKKIVAGPYHEDFRNLVESSIWYDSIVEKIKKFNVKVKEVKIEVNPQDMQNAIGYEEENINKLNELYDVIAKVEGNQNIKPGESQITIIEVYKN